MQTERETNTLYAGLFGITLAVLILIQAILVFILKKARDQIETQNIEWNPQTLKSRAIPKIKEHEKCDFPYNKQGEDKQLQLLDLDKKKKKVKGVLGLDD